MIIFFSFYIENNRIVFMLKPNRRVRRHQFDYLITNDQFNSKEHQRIALQSKPVFRPKQTVENEAQLFYKNPMIQRKPSNFNQQKRIIPTKEKTNRNNDVQHLAQLTAKFNSSAPSTYSLYLADRNPSTSSHLQYYIKPYRGDKPFINQHQTKLKTKTKTQLKTKMKSSPYVNIQPTTTIEEKEDEIFEEYEIILENMKSIDEQLELKTNERDLLLSPMMIQMSLFSLIIFNFILFYFFNEIHLWWQNNIQPQIILQDKLTQRYI